MKIALAQNNYHIGNFESNKQKIVESIEQAKSKGVDLLVFSELAICGSFPTDLLKRKEFIDKCEQTLNEVLEYCTEIAVIIGLPKFDGENLRNVAVFIENKQTKKIFNKEIIQREDQNDEFRYFASDDKIEKLNFMGKKLHVAIGASLYALQGPCLDFGDVDLLINISAEKYSSNMDLEREIRMSAIRQDKPVVYVNQVGANTDSIYKGNSLFIGSDGKVLARAKSFEEDLLVFDTEDENSGKLEVSVDIRIEEIYHALVLGLKDYFAKSGFKKAVLGLSGGIDSALVLAIAKAALGSENVCAILMPTLYSSDHSIDDSVEMAKRCNVEYHIVSVENLRLEFENTLSEIFANTAPNVTEENIQARARGAVLMAYSNKFGHVVLNTSNKSEAAVGYSTLYGDTNGALSILGDVYKTDVYKMSNYINENIEDIIPQNIITKPPSAELRPNQKDNDSLPDYNTLDSVLMYYLGDNMSETEIIGRGFFEDEVKFILNLVKASEYKRYQFPPILKISSHPFGFERRMPIVAKQ